MNPEQAERIASALETIASRLGHISSALDALANQGDLMTNHAGVLVDTLDHHLRGISAELVELRS